jgi:hypothetical protein
MGRKIEMKAESLMKKFFCKRKKLIISEEFPWFVRRDNDAAVYEMDLPVVPGVFFFLTAELITYIRRKFK